MSNPKKYSANLTGAWFLFFEIKQVAKMINQGLNEKEIKSKVITDNVFQHKKESSVIRALPTVYRRAALLGDDLRKALIEEPPYSGKIINLFAIMKEDLLFEEFLIELIGHKYSTNTMFIEPKDINSFFTQKSEQNLGFSKYSTTTINKLRQVYLRILLEADILKDQKSGELNKMQFDPYIEELFKENHGQAFLNIFK